VIRDPRPQAFCAGYLRPVVYVLRRTVELLSDVELDAVLAHERHHRRVRDPLRIACGGVLGEALFFLPALRPLCDRYADVAELNADRAAVHASAGREAPLASALLVFDESAPAGVSGISPERVDSLLGQLAAAGMAIGCFARRVVGAQPSCVVERREGGRARGVQPADPLIAPVCARDEHPRLRSLL
jgi:hypothetical protein